MAKSPTKRSGIRSRPVHSLKGFISSSIIALTSHEQTHDLDRHNSG